MSNSKNKDFEFTSKDVLNMLSAVERFIEEMARIYNQYNNEPASGSMAFQEQTSFPNNELIKDVHYRGMLSAESAADHLMVFADSVAEPAKTVAPWTCVRGLLESCALAAWFLDSTVDAKSRVGRCFAFRYVGFVQQIKLGQVTKRPSEIDKTRQRMTKVEEEAVSLGYPRLLNKIGEINGIAQRMPNITELIGTTLNREFEYRIMSAVAHGHHWATQQIGFRVVETQNSEGQAIKALEKHLHPNLILFLAHIAVTSYAKVIWYLWQLYGWNLKEVEHLLETTYEQLGYNPQLRFWHSASSTS
jgi:hypothetical protein